MTLLDALDSEARRSVRDFCHDARQPIATIGALLGCLRSPSAGADLELRLDQIAGQLAELRDMADRVLLDEVRPRWLDLGRELADLVDGFRLLHPGRIELTMDEDVRVHADALALRRVLRNLLDNASRAQPDGCIVVQLRRSGPGCRITIADHGSARTGWGVGVGLGIVGRLAEQNGARVDISTSESGSVVVLEMSCGPRRALPEPA